jgi:hypothetical protein
LSTNLDAVKAFFIELGLELEGENYSRDESAPAFSRHVARFIGHVRYVSHESEKPMRITCKWMPRCRSTFSLE